MYSERRKGTPTINKKQTDNPTEEWAEDNYFIRKGTQMAKQRPQEQGLCLLVGVCFGDGRGVAGSHPPELQLLNTPDSDNQNQRQQGAFCSTPQRLTRGGGVTTVSTTTSGRTLSIPWQCYASEHTQQKCVHICTKKQVRTFRAASVKPRDNSDTHEWQKE